MYLTILIVLVMIFIYFVDKKERKHDKEPKQEPNQPTTLKLYNPDDLDTKQTVSIIDETSDLKLFY